MTFMRVVVTCLLIMASLAEARETHPGQRVLLKELAAETKAGRNTREAWKNLKDVLADAGMTPENIVRLNIYTTDVDAFMGAAGDLIPVFAGDGCKPVSTLLGVARLYDPAILIELEATAVA